MKKILVIGSSNTDMIIRAARIPRPGETVLGGEFSMAPGGKRANQAVAAARAAAALRRRGPGLVIVTMGDRGCYALGGEFRGPVPAFPATAVDTTAAGDVFNGALAVALAERRPLAGALRFASAAAALSVTKPGAQPSAPGRGEIERFMTRQPIS